MTDDSFQFGNYNSVDDMGIRMIYVDVLSPQKRRNIQEIPFKQGVYTYDGTYYNNREIRISCEWTRNIEDIPTHKIREIAYMLSKKAYLRFFNEDDKYYDAELFDASSITRYYNENIMYFDLTFICSPFAQGSSSSQLLSTTNTIDYQGTAPTRPLLILENTSSTVASNFTITIYRKE